MTADTFFCLEKYDSCCFTGHRVLPKSEEDRNILRDKLRSTIAQLAKEGIYRFYTGGARGFDSMAAMAVLEMKAYFPQIQLYLALPYPQQYEQWPQRRSRSLNRLQNMQIRWRLSALFIPRTV